MPYRTFVEALAEREPLLIYDGQAYLVSPSPREHSIKLGEAELGLVPCGSIDDLAQWHRHLYADELFAFKKKYVEENTTFNFKQADEREREIGGRRLFSFIVGELMPFMSGHREDLSELLGEEIKRQQVTTTTKMDDKELEPAKAEMRRKEAGYAKQFGCETEGEYLGRMVGSSLALSGRFYNLVSTGKQTGDVVINNGKAHSYMLVPGATVAQIEMAFRPFCEWRARVEAVDELATYLTDMQKTMVAATQNVDKIMQLKEFNDGDIGFLRKDDAVWVYQICKPFAMMDPRPKNKGYCYEFPRCRVGMQIDHDGRRITLREPYLFEGVGSPFTGHPTDEFQHLCGGHVPPRENYSEVEWVAKALDDAKNLVVSGLTPASIRQHGGDRDDGGQYYGVNLDTILRDKKITVEEAKKKGLLLTNRWEWDNGRY